MNYLILKINKSLRFQAILLFLAICIGMVSCNPNAARQSYSERRIKMIKEKRLKEYHNLHPSLSELTLDDLDDEGEILPGREYKYEKWRFGPDGKYFQREADPTVLPPPRMPAEERYARPYQPSRTRYHDLQHTSLKIAFDWANEWVLGTARLRLNPYFYATDSLHLDAKGFEIKNVQLILKDYDVVRNLNYKYNGKILSIGLDRKYTRDETFEVLIEYVAGLGEAAGGSNAITSDKGIYFINAQGRTPHKPRQIWTQGETEASSRWFPTIDATNERCTQDIEITVESKYKTLSNGLLVESRNNQDGTRTDKWVMDQPHAPYLFMMAVGEFSIVKDKWRDLEVSYYVEPEYEPYARSIFGNTPEMIEFYSKILGLDYPWKKYSQVVVRDFVSGAMENTTATVHMEALQQDHRGLLDNTYEDYIAHELFHQWFGDYVTCESWANLPLNEAFATYSEYLWLEHKYGENEAQEHLENDWNIYNAESYEKKTALVRFHHRDPHDMFDAHSYQKGGMVLHMLRNYLGDEAFFQGLRKYLHKNAYSDVEVHELRLAMEDVSGQDLNWFFNQWFYFAGHPELEIYYRYDEEKQMLNLEITQLQNLIYYPLFVFPTEVEIAVNGKATRFPIKIEKVDSTYQFPMSTRPQAVIFDPDRVLLAQIYERDKTMENWVYQLEHSTNYRTRLKAIENLASYLDVTEVEALFIRVLQDKFWATRKAIIENFDTRADYSPPIYVLQQIQKIAETDPDARVRLAALNYLAHEKRDIENVYLSTFEKALNDSSYKVVERALGMLYLYKPKEALEAAKRMKNTRSTDLMYQISEILLNEQDPDAASYAMRTYYTLSGFLNKAIFFNQLVKYVEELPVTDEWINFLMNVTENDDVTQLRMYSARSLANYRDRAEVQEFFQQIKKKEKNKQLRELYEKEF